jgi:hypothetical protein
VKAIGGDGTRADIRGKLKSQFRSESHSLTWENDLRLANVSDCSRTSFRVLKVMHVSFLCLADLDFRRAADDDNQRRAEIWMARLLSS